MQSFPTPLSMLHTQQRPPIVLLTLGGLAVELHGQAANWRDVGVGVPALRRMLSYFVAHRGTFIARKDLCLIGSGRRDDAYSLPYFAVGLGTLLRRWGLRNAIVRERGRLKLSATELWCTDTDLIVAFRKQADAAFATGHVEQAYDLLTRAAHLCQGPYMHGYDAPSAYSLDRAMQYWSNYQYEIVGRLARVCLQMHDQAAYTVGCQALEHVILLLGEPLAIEQALLAELHKRLGNDRTAALLCT